MIPCFTNYVIGTSHGITNGNIREVLRQNIGLQIAKITTTKKTFEDPDTDMNGNLSLHF